MCCGPSSLVHVCVTGFMIQENAYRRPDDRVRYTTNNYDTHLSDTVLMYNGICPRDAYTVHVWITMAMTR